jgi:3-oxoacyl-[acyl-carrier-protein] synthase-3
MGLGGDADQFEAIQRKGGGARMPWPVAADGHEANFYLQMNGTSVFKHAVVGFSEQIEQTLARENLKPEDIAWVVPHQANERILKAVSKRVGIPYDKFVVSAGGGGSKPRRLYLSCFWRKVNARAVMRARWALLAAPPWPPSVFS